MMNSKVQNLNASLTESLFKIGLLCFSLVILTTWSVGIARGQESIQERRLRLTKMKPEELKDLKKKWESFKSLSKQEQDRFRTLHEEISNDPNSDRLKSLMSRYAQWSKTLSYAERDELLRLSPDKRVEKIREFMQKQDRLQSEKEPERERRRFRGLAGIRISKEEAEKLFQWLETFALEHKDKIRKMVPESNLRWLEKEIKEENRRLHIMLQWIVWNHKELPALTADDIDRLRKISPRLSQELDSYVGEPQEQDKRIQQWIRAATHARMSHRRGRPPRHRPSQEDLDRFFREKLNPQQQNYIEGLPHEESLHELGRMYYHYRRFMNPERDNRPGPPDHRRDGPSRSRGRGPEDRDRKKHRPPHPGEI